MKRLKVLTLGWEFPPIINGGLGVASYGLTKAISKLADVTLILPKSDPSMVLENVELIGLNHVDIEKLKLIEEIDETYETFSQVEYIDSDFSPYKDNLTDLTTEITKKEVTKKFNYLDDIGAFAIDDLYGHDMWEKVHKFARLAVRIAADKEFDVIHAHDWMTFIAGCEIKAKYHKPLVLHVHALETDRTTTDNRGDVYHIEKSAMEYADLVVPVSNYTAQQIVQYYQIPKDKIFAVHNGLEPVQTYKTVKSFPEKMILYLGRLTGQKGPGYFLEVAHRVTQKVDDVRFVMAGTGDRLKNLIETGAYKRLGSKFHFTGFLNREKVHQLYSMADVYVMPSVSEPFGLSALEAAQFGVPCVISNQSGVSEVLHHALKADFWDVDTMANQIIELLQNQEKRDQVIHDTYADLKNITWDNSANELVNKMLAI